MDQDNIYLTQNTLSFKRKGTVNRRATIFAGDFDPETDDLIHKNYTKGKNDLKRQEKL